MPTSNPSPELEVLQTLQRIDSQKKPFWAVYIAMSLLSEENRGYRQLEIVSKLLHPLLQDSQSRLFVLSNHDFLLITAETSLQAIDNVLYQIRSLFADDDVLQLQDTSLFQKIFFLDKEMDVLKQIISNHIPSDIAEEEQNSPSQEQQSIETDAPRPLMPADIDDVLDKIDRIDLADFMHRQSILKIPSFGHNKIFAHEYYTSILSLQQAICPDIDLDIEKTLFHLICEKLDNRLIATLPNLNLIAYPQTLHLNLNLSSVNSDFFDTFVQSLPCSLTVEFQIADILANLPLFFQKEKELHAKGIQIAIDAIGPNEWRFSNIFNFQVDFIKLFWTQEWTNLNIDDIKKAIASHPNTQIILSRCGSEDAMIWGKKVGISLFQGYIVDVILTALAKNSCTFGQECSLSACMACRSSLSPKNRSSCVHQPHLDSTLDGLLDVSL